MQLNAKSCQTVLSIPAVVPGIIDSPCEGAEPVSCFISSESNLAITAYPVPVLTILPALCYFLFIILRS